MVHLAWRVLIHLCWEVRRDTHIEHDRLDLLHFLWSAIKLVSRKFSLDLFSDLHHLAWLLLERLQVRECIRDLILCIGRLLLFTPLNSGNTSIDTAWLRWWGDHGWLLISHWLSDNFHGPMPLAVRLLHHFKKTISCLVVEAQRDWIA